jgi:hypothetical protein
MALTKTATQADIFSELFELVCKNKKGFVFKMKDRTS